MAEVEPTSWKKGIAEMVGTLTLIYVGVLAIVTGADLVGVALAHGLAIAVMVSALMTISGGQFNPAVTVGLLVARKITPAQAGLNVIMQLVGGILGGYLAKVTAEGAGYAMGGVPSLAATVSPGIGMLVEAILTFFLVLVVFGSLVDHRFGARIGGLAIGLTITMDILAGGPITGASMNPARWLGAAVPAASYADPLVYVVAPLVGGIVAALLYQYVFWEEPRPRAEPQAELRAKGNP